MRLCYKCEQVGHVIKDCKTVLFCDVCGKDSHLTAKCVLPHQPKATVQLVGSAADGLQMFVAPLVKKTSVEPKDAMALVNVHVGEINAEQLVNAFKRMFQWGWTWTAKAYAPGSFLMKFPSVEKINELHQFGSFCLIGERAEILVSRWSSETLAQFKLSSVWVKLSGIPESLLNYQGFCMAGSILGTVQEVDMVSYRKHDVIRVKVGVMDHLKIPEWGPLTVDPFIYRIFFQVERVVEIGGPLIGGVVVRNTSSQPRQSIEQDGTRQQKRFRDGQDGKHDAELPKELGDQEMVVSSQPEADGLNVLHRGGGMLDFQGERAEHSDRISVVNQVNLRFAKETEQLDNLECSDAESEPNSPTQFARKCGLGTQAINEMNAMDYNVESPENVVPIGTPPA